MRRASMAWGVMFISVATTVPMWFNTAALAESRTVLVSASDTVHVRRAPITAGWKVKPVSGPGWRRVGLPVRTPNRGARRALLVRRVIRVPEGDQQLRIRLRTRSTARLWIDGTRVGRVPAGGGKVTVPASAGRHVLAIRLKRLRTAGLRLRVLSLRAVPPVSDGAPSPTPSPSPTRSAPPDEPVSAITRVCTIKNPLLPELSGMAPGVADASILWVHNDSGDSPRIFALDRRTCAIRAEVDLAGVSASDIEGIAMGRARDGSGELWVGDIGDNGSARASVRLYRFPEPTVRDQRVSVRTVTVTWTGGPRDCESIAVDPIANGHVYLVSKKDSASGIHRLQGDYRSTGVATTGPPLATTGKYATDAAIAPDRSLSVIRFYTAAEMRTSVLPGTAPVRESMPAQRQGEAIAFAPDSGSVYLASEGSDDLIRIPLNVWGR